MPPLFLESFIASMLYGASFCVVMKATPDDKGHWAFFGMSVLGATALSGMLKGHCS